MSIECSCHKIVYKLKVDNPENSIQIRAKKELDLIRLSDHIKMVSIKLVALITIISVVGCLALVCAAPPPPPPGPVAPLAPAPPAGPPALPAPESEDDYDDEDYLADEDDEDYSGDEEDFEDDLEEELDEMMEDQLEEEIEEEQLDLAEALYDYSSEKRYCKSLVVGKPDPDEPTHIITDADVKACFDDLKQLEEEIAQETQELNESMNEEEEYESMVAPPSSTVQPATGASPSSSWFKW